MAAVEEHHQAQRRGIPVALVLVVLIGFGALVAALVNDHRQRRVAGWPAAVARVDRFENGTCLFGAKHTRCMDLTLTVVPVGAAPFSLTVNHSVDVAFFSRVQPGSWLTVRIGPDAEVAVDDEAFSLPPPAPAIP